MLTEDNMATVSFRLKKVAEAKKRHRIKVKLSQHTYFWSFQISAFVFPHKIWGSWVFPRKQKAVMSEG